MASDFFITTPIYYANARPHLGHAYTTIIADGLTRFHKSLGEKTLFLTGTDEHGDKIVQAAEKNRLSPKAFVDEISSKFSSLWPKLSVSPDHFTRTTSESHKKVVRELLQKIYDAGDIYFGEFGGYYCYGCERFYTEKELENGLCPQHQTPPEFIREKNYFFKMSKYLPWLKTYLEEKPETIRPERYLRETLGMLESGGIDDLCISRPKSRLEWGIELPFDSNYVCYVWFDALASYIGDLGWPDGEEFRRFWPGSHLIAKDILKPHAIFWPCMLKAAGLSAYKHLDVHGYWLVRDTKMSKSLGNVIEPLETSQKYGLDAFRYFLFREMRFGSDASFNEENLTLRVNADLANDLGNLFSRVLSMNAKYFGGRVPEGAGFNEDDGSIIRLCADSLNNYLNLFPRLEFPRALESLWEFIGALNKYIDVQAPWRLFKAGETKRLATIFNLLLASLKKIAIALWPIMPDAAAKMLAQLGEEELSSRSAAGQAPTPDMASEAEKFELLPPGQVTASSSNLFPRMEIKLDAEKEKNKNNPDNRRETVYEDISNFKKFEIRAGTVIAAEKHPGADRILILTINLGEDKPRRILSGIAQDYKPEDLIGKKVCAILNLPPRKIRGVESNGMVLTAGDDKKTVLLTCDEAIDDGALIG